VKHSLRWHYAPVDEQLWEVAEEQAEEVVSAVTERLSIPGEILRFEDVTASAARARRIKRFSHWRRPVYSIPFFLTKLSVAELIKVIGLQSVKTTIHYLREACLFWPAFYRLVVTILKSPVAMVLGGIWVLLIKRYKGKLAAEKILQFPFSVYFRILLLKSTVLSWFFMLFAVTFTHDDSD
jgi:hypothetical protein